MTAPEMRFADAADAAISAALEEIGRERREIAERIDSEMQRLLIRCIARAICAALNTSTASPAERRIRERREKRPVR